MSWKRILVHIKPYRDCTPAIDAAIQIAKPLGAHLTGLYTMRELAMLKTIFGPNHKAVLEAASRDQPLTDKAEHTFRSRCEPAGIVPDWDVAEGNSGELLSLAGRCHDLIVVQQSLRGLDELGTDIAEECAILSGVPTLIVPSTGTNPTFPKQVVVAWNHSRQSAAALRGAMPLIERADRVIALVGERRDLTSSVTKAPRHDIAELLKAHATKVEMVPFAPSGGDDGSHLLKAAHEAKGDVLVMGAYGRSAWREFLLGGATRQVITNLDIPVLMGH
jgi:nucleotide-binding universal stress UspA family protein